MIITAVLSEQSYAAVRRYAMLTMAESVVNALKREVDSSLAAVPPDELEEVKRLCERVQRDTDEQDRGAAVTATTPRKRQLSDDANEPV